jgi:hypothetical protein
MCVGDFVKRYTLRDARADDTGCQQAEKLLKVFLKPGGMSRPHQIDRVNADALATR